MNSDTTTKPSGKGILLRMTTRRLQSSVPDAARCSPRLIEMAGNGSARNDRDNDSESDRCNDSTMSEWWVAGRPGAVLERSQG